MRVYVVVPTFNEAENLPSLAAEIVDLPLLRSKLIIVDDASPDGTGLVADRLAKGSYGRISVLHRSGQRGLGLAYRDGFRRALELGAEVVIQMDADFSHAPIDVLRLVEELASCDVAVGSRYIEGGRVEHTWGRERLVLSRTANLMSRTILGLRTRDATSGFKAWRRAALEAVDIGRVQSNGYLFQEEMTYLSERLGLRVHEIPIFFADRRLGRSKMTLRTKLEAAAGLVRLRQRHRKVRQIPLFVPE